MQHSQQCQSIRRGSSHETYINMPFEFQVQLPQNQPEPTEILVLFQVRECLSFDRYPVLGYGAVKLYLDQPGRYHSRIGISRPIKDSVHDETARFFLGQSPELEDGGWMELKNLLKTRRPAEVINRFGSRMQGTGWIHMEYNVAYQLQEPQRRLFQSHFERPAFRSLEQDQQAIHKARARLATYSATMQTPTSPVLHQPQ